MKAHLDNSQYVLKILVWNINSFCLDDLERLSEKLNWLQGKVEDFSPHIIYLNECRSDHKVTLSNCKKWMDSTTHRNTIFAFDNFGVEEPVPGLLLLSNPSWEMDFFFTYLRPEKNDAGNKKIIEELDLRFIKKQKETFIMGDLNLRFISPELNKMMAGWGEPSDTDKKRSVFIQRFLKRRVSILEKMAPSDHKALFISINLPVALSPMVIDHTKSKIKFKNFLKENFPFPKTGIFMPIWSKDPPRRFEIDRIAFPKFKESLSKLYLSYFKYLNFTKNYKKREPFFSGVVPRKVIDDARIQFRHNDTKKWGTMMEEVIWTLRTVKLTEVHGLLVSPQSDAPDLNFFYPKVMVSFLKDHIKKGNIARKTTEKEIEDIKKQIHSVWTKDWEIVELRKKLEILDKRIENQDDLNQAKRWIAKVLEMRIFSLDSRVFFLKKGEFIEGLDDLRLISITAAILKVLDKLHAGKISDWILWHIKKEILKQGKLNGWAGFPHKGGLPNSSCFDAAFNLLLKGFDSEYFFFLVDMKRAYESTDLLRLLDYLGEVKNKDKAPELDILIAIIKLYYISDTMIENTKIKKTISVLMGGVLSPAIFVLYLHMVFMQEGEFKSLYLNGELMFYLDDIIGRLKVVDLSLVERLAVFLRSQGLSVNFKKSLLLVKNANEESVKKMRMLLPCETEALYLGYRITNEGKKEIIILYDELVQGFSTRFINRTKTPLSLGKIKLYSYFWGKLKYTLALGLFFNTPEETTWASLQKSSRQILAQSFYRQELLRNHIVFSLRLTPFHHLFHNIKLFNRIDYEYRETPEARKLLINFIGNMKKVLLTIPLDCSQQLAEAFEEGLLGELNRISPHNEDSTLETGWFFYRKVQVGKEELWTLCVSKNIVSNTYGHLASAIRSHYYEKFGWSYQYMEINRIFDDCPQMFHHSFIVDAISARFGPALEALREMESIIVERNNCEYKKDWALADTVERINLWWQKVERNKFALVYDETKVASWIYSIYEKAEEWNKKDVAKDHSQFSGWKKRQQGVNNLLTVMDLGYIRFLKGRYKKGTANPDLRLDRFFGDNVS